MENVAPTGALARRNRNWMQLAFVIVTAGVFIAVVGLTFYVIPLAVPSNEVFPFYNFLRAALLFGGAVLALIGLGLVARAVFTRYDNDLALVTGNYLRDYLDDRYVFVRNVNKRDLGYIDAVLVGPPGALVFRILDEMGVYANEEASWLKQERDDWVPARIDPTRDVVIDVKALRQFLTEHGLGYVPVYGIVVFNNDEMQTKLAVRDPVVPVANLPRLYDRLREPNNYLAREDRIDMETIQAVRDLIHER
jgi:hypothetical protein